MATADWSIEKQLQTLCSQDSASGLGSVVSALGPKGWCGGGLATECMPTAFIQCWMSERAVLHYLDYASVFENHL